MKIEEYLNTLPKSIITGEEVDLHDNTLREIFEFSGLNKNDIFFHLGCGNGHSLSIALEEFSVKKAIGVDINNEKILAAKKIMESKNLSNYVLKYENILETDLNDATVILFWFSDESIIEKMVTKFSSLRKGCKIITIWGPLPGHLPDKVEFPYIMNEIPLKKASGLKEQITTVFGTDCIDFVTAWEFADRYAKAIASENVQNDRFLTILQTLIIWINAKNLGMSCEDGVPMPIRNYIGILKTYFGIEMEHLLDQETL